MTVPVAGGAVTTLAPGIGVTWNVAVDGTVFWFTAEGSAWELLAVPAAGGNVASIAVTVAPPLDLTIGGTTPYWLAGGSILGSTY